MPDLPQKNKEYKGCFLRLGVFALEKLGVVADVQPVGSGEPALKYLAAYVYSISY
jgi:hypothetical protein